MRFTEPHPQLRGSSSYQIADNRILFSIDEIANPRPEGDISGTLSVELWALNQPYQGGGFDGAFIAGAPVGEIFGQHFVANSQYWLDFIEPPIGSWHLTLMLREWSYGEYVTRDFINFPTLYISQPAAATVQVVANDDLEPKPEPAAKPTRKRAAAKPADATISINRATLEELAATKGMSSKLAENIIAERPFTSLDALLKVKGMGPKLLAKLRSLLSL